MKKLIIPLIILFVSLWMSSIAVGAIIVGRIGHVEGQIYRYLDGDQSWVETFPDSPAGTQDILMTGADSRAEIKFPNNIVLRLDENTEIEITQLGEETSQFLLQKGLARFSNRAPRGDLSIDTVRGTAKVRPGSSADVQANEEVVTVAAVQGKATFQTFDNGLEKHEVITETTSLEFHAASIVAGIGPIDRNWDRWCASRESIWDQNHLVRSEYLPETMQEYAHVLEPNGSWRRVYYRGYYYWAWQPLYVTAGWAPYSTGYWYDWHDEPVWIDYNPWGWVTHHHGHWLHLDGIWMWTPYVHVSHVPGITAVGFTIHFGRQYRPYWHPGRVRWIRRNSYTGWLPLAPWETYYGRHRWGPRSVAFSKRSNYSINISLANHRYIDHAVIVPDHHFKRNRPVARDHYTKARIRNINKTAIINNYKAIPFARERKISRRDANVTGTRRIIKSSTLEPKKRVLRPQKPSREVTYPGKRDWQRKKTRESVPRRKIIVKRQEKFRARAPESAGNTKKVFRQQRTDRSSRRFRSEQSIQSRKTENPRKKVITETRVRTRQSKVVSLKENKREVNRQSIQTRQKNRRSRDQHHGGWQRPARSRVENFQRPGRRERIPAGINNRDIR